jgi:hypothetical protein
VHGRLDKLLGFNIQRSGEFLAINLLVHTSLLESAVFSHGIISNKSSKKKIIDYLFLYMNFMLNVNNIILGTDKMMRKRCYNGHEREEPTMLG